MTAKKRKTPKRRVDDPVVQVAILDAGGVLTGYGSYHRSDIPAGCIEVPDECDLQPGKYSYSTASCAFWPIMDETPVATTAGPVAGDFDFIRAIWKGFVSLRAAGHEFPAETLAWMDQYGRSFDAKG